MDRLGNRCIHCTPAEAKDSSLAHAEEFANARIYVYSHLDVRSLAEPRAGAPLQLLDVPAPCSIPPQGYQPTVRDSPFLYLNVMTPHPVTADPLILRCFTPTAVTSLQPCNSDQGPGQRGCGPAVRDRAQHHGLSWRIVAAERLRCPRANMPLVFYWLCCCNDCG